MEAVRLVGASYLLLRRPGPRPRASAGLPFRQLDQFPPIGMTQRLVEMCLDLPGVRSRQSRVAPPQSRALCLIEPPAAGPPEAFIDGREFCHLHAPPEGSIHLTLPPADAEAIIALGWAERHPIHSAGLHANLVMVYAPRDAAELENVFRLVEHSRRFAGGVAAG